MLPGNQGYLAVEWSISVAQVLPKATKIGRSPLKRTAQAVLV